ncbi:MAG TPA: lipoyl(octanoyl) transferase LipB [Caldisericia bacterium]|jgi:lipoyl(octanoyl) transferase|nr:lipoyl(octanoyl) transferase LipB [Caldisericia bacterium]HXK51231.1 lipoyl(octanoyl) transferase LipB [Caldisericia bacterium]
MKKICWFTSCGTVPYDIALEWQKTIVEAKMKQDLEDVMLFLEHPPVITIGKNGNPSNILIGSKQCKDQGISIYPISRGGDVTFHGPGQIVGYPLFDLQHFDKSIRNFVTHLEQVFISLLQDSYQLSAQRIPGYTGVWIDNNKITAMGLSVHKYITMHGFAFNVSTDLKYFRMITPCGISDKGVTTLNIETGKQNSIDTCIQQIGEEMSKCYPIDMEWKPLQKVLETFGISYPEDVNDQT